MAVKMLILDFPIHKHILQLSAAFIYMGGLKKGVINNQNRNWECVALKALFFLHSFQCLFNGDIQS